MNMKTMIPLVIALVLGVVAAKMGKDMMSKGKTDPAASMKLTKVAIVKGDIAPGSVLQETDLTLGNFPAENVPQGTFPTTAELVNRVVTTQLVKGQAILDTLLAPRGASGGAQAMVPPGWRAVTLEVNEVNGVAGLLAPGCRVDVVQTIRVKDNDADGMMAKTIVENLRVIAVGRRMTTVGPEPEQLARSVTILATQEQSEVLDLASRLGTPRLVLRNTLDDKTLGGKGVTVASLRGVRKDEQEPSSVAGAFLKIFGDPSTRPSNTRTDKTDKADKTTKPETAKVEAPTSPEPQYRQVEIIRAGASTNVRLPLAPLGPMTGGAEKLEPVPGTR